MRSRTREAAHVYVFVRAYLLCMYDYYMRAHCVRIYMRACVRVCTCAGLRECACVRACVRACMRTYIRTCVGHIFVRETPVHEGAPVPVYLIDCMCVRVWARVFLRLRVRARLRAGVRACICMYDLP